MVWKDLMGHTTKLFQISSFSDYIPIVVSLDVGNFLVMTYTGRSQFALTSKKERASTYELCKEIFWQCSLFLFYIYELLLYLLPNP